MTVLLLYHCSVMRQWLKKWKLTNNTFTLYLHSMSYRIEYVLGPEYQISSAQAAATT